jgi:putative transposase
MSNNHVIKKVENYLRYYNEERIQEKVGYLAPKEFGAVAA